MQICLKENLLLNQYSLMNYFVVIASKALARKALCSFLETKIVIAQ